MMYQADPDGLIQLDVNENAIPNWFGVMFLSASVRKGFGIGNWRMEKNLRKEWRGGHSLKNENDE